MLRIDRSLLVEQLHSFVTAGNGVVVGSPGVGKTFAVADLAARFVSEMRPCLFVPVTDLGNATSKAIRLGLRADRDPLDKFRDDVTASAGPSGVVIVDSFDAARDPKVRLRVLSFIRRLVAEAGGDWQVLVTVRTYDAAKSSDLLELFPAGSIEDPQVAQQEWRTVRQFEVPLLEQAEVDRAIEQIRGLHTIYASAGPGFRELLRTPFNIWLVEGILGAHPTPSGNDQTPLLSGTESEIELLTRYWRRWVTDAHNGMARTTIVSSLAQAMVRGRTMAVQTQRAYRMGPTDAWQDLLSGEVLTQAGPGDRVVAFRHNILFDYATSIYVMQEAPRDLAKMLRADPARTLFLRPALLYLFARLWHTDAARFWQAFDALLAETDVAVRLVGRLIPPYVVATGASDAGQLRHSTAGQRMDDEHATAVLRVLQAVSFAERIDLPTWITFIAECSRAPHGIFAWEALSLLDRLLDRADVSNEGVSTVRATAAEASRGFLEWVWRERAAPASGVSRSWLDAFGATWAVRLVLRTLDADPAAGGALLKPILELPSEPNFPIRYLYTLSDGIESVIRVNPAFAADVYRKVFGYQEKSDEKTLFGGIVLRLQSTRRQDYQMCQFVLAKAYPAFLYAAPAIAIAAGLDSVWITVVRDHVSSLWEDENGVAQDPPPPEKLVFRGRDAEILPDASFIWAPSARDDAIALLHHLRDYLAAECGTLAAGTAGVSDRVDAELDTFATHARVAVAWSALFEAGVAAPAALGRALYELCLQRPIQRSVDVRYALGRFLEVASKYWSAAERHAFEISVLSLPKDAPNEAAVMREGWIRDLLLARIPQDLLESDAAREHISVLSAAGALLANVPQHQVTVSHGAYTADDAMRDQGVDIDRPDNAKLRAELEPLRDFVVASRSEVPQPDQIEAILPHLERVRASVMAEVTADPPVRDEAWTTLASAAAVVARTNPMLNSPTRTLLRGVLFEAVGQPIPAPPGDVNETYTSAHWSPTPQIEAIQGLAALSVVQADDQIIAAIEALVITAPWPSWRLVGVGAASRLLRHAPEAFWRVMERAADVEPNVVVVTAIVAGLRSTVARFPRETVMVLQRIYDRWQSTDEARLAHSMAILLVYLACRDEPWCERIITDSHEGLLSHTELVGQINFHALSAVTVETIRDERVASVIARAVQITLGGITAIAREATRLRALTPSEDDEGRLGALSQLHTMIGEIVSRVYFNARPDLSRSRQSQVVTDEVVPVDLDRLNKYWQIIRPIIDRIVDAGRIDATGGIIAPTAHHLIELFQLVLYCDPPHILHLAAQVVEASKPHGYNLDSSAAAGVVTLVEIVLADHREVLLDQTPLDDTLRLLDAFTATGWPAALQLVWRLDEVFR